MDAPESFPSSSRGSLLPPSESTADTPNVMASVPAMMDSTLPAATADRAYQSNTLGLNNASPPSSPLSSPPSSLGSSPPFAIPEAMASAGDVFGDTIDLEAFDFDDPGEEVSGTPTGSWSSLSSPLSSPQSSPPPEGMAYTHYEGYIAQGPHVPAHHSTGARPLKSALKRSGSFSAGIRSGKTMKLAGMKSPGGKASRPPPMPKPTASRRSARIQEQQKARQGAKDETRRLKLEQELRKEQLQASPMRESTYRIVDGSPSVYNGQHEHLFSEATRLKRTAQGKIREDEVMLTLRAPRQWNAPKVVMIVDKMAIGEEALEWPEEEEYEEDEEDEDEAEAGEEAARGGYQGRLEQLKTLAELEEREKGLEERERDVSARERRLAEKEKAGQGGTEKEAMLDWVAEAARKELRPFVAKNKRKRFDDHVESMVETKRGGGQSKKQRRM